MYIQVPSIQVNFANFCSYGLIKTFRRMMKLNFMAIKISIWFGLLSISTWWGSRSVIRYWNQPLTTNMVYSFGDNENGIQFPLMTFCDDEFVSKKIKIECKVGLANTSKIQTSSSSQNLRFFHSQTLKNLKF